MADQARHSLSWELFVQVDRIMTDNITLTDGSTPTTYAKWRPMEQVSKDTWMTTRKVADRDSTPESLTIRHTIANGGSSFRSQALILTSKEDSVTGKVHSGRFGIFYEADTKHWTQAEVEKFIEYLKSLIGTSGFKAEFATGQL